MNHHECTDNLKKPVLANQCESQIASMYIVRRRFKAIFRITKIITGSKDHAHTHWMFASFGNVRAAVNL